jgi:hypothetical protein
MHMGVYVYAANVAQHESIPRINPTWDQKILGLYLHVKNLGMAIQK